MMEDNGCTSTLSLEKFFIICLFNVQSNVELEMADIFVLILFQWLSIFILKVLRDYPRI